MYTVSIKSIEISIESSQEIFSPNSLDRGTAAMLDLTDLPNGKILDLGCGCGVIGIYAAKAVGEENVVMCDISEEAVRISRENAERNGVSGVRIYQSDGFSEIPDRDFSLILSNPPYHADFSVAKRFISDGYQRLALGGRLVMVTKRLDWYKNRISAVFGGVRVAERDGYFIFTAEKRPVRPRTQKPKQKLSRKLGRKYGRG